MTAKSEFFTPVRLPTAANASKPKPPPKVVWDENILSDAKKAIAKEYERIRVGTSDLVPGAIDNGKHKTPAENAIERSISNFPGLSTHVT